MKEGDGPEDRKQLGSVAELVAELARTRKDRLDLGACPALHHPQREAADHLQPQFVPLALGAVGHAAQHAESTVGERQRLGEGEQPDGVACALEEVLCARAEITGGFEERAQTPRGARVLALVVGDQGPRDTSTQRCTASRLERRIERVLIEDVHELVPQRERQVGKLVLGDPLDEHVHVLERVEAFFHVRRIHRRRFADHGGVELVSLHARREQELAVHLPEALDLPRDHAANRCRHFTERLLFGPREYPAAVLFDQAPGIAEVSNDIGHEQRIAVGLRMDLRRKRGRKAVLRKHDRQISLDVHAFEEPELDLLERAVPAQLLADREERVLRQRHVGGPIRRHDEQSHLIEAARKVVQHVDRGHVRPLQVVEKEDERTQPGRFLQQGAELALHPFLRQRGRFLAHARDRVVAAFRMRNLNVPTRRDGLDQRVHRAPRRRSMIPPPAGISMEQVVERLEKRQIGLRARQPLGAAAANGERALGLQRDLRQKIVHEVRLANPRLAQNGQHPAVAVPHLFVGMAHPFALRLAAHGSAFDDRRASERVDPTRLTRREHRETLFDFAGGRAQGSVLLEHAMHQALERRRNRRIDTRQGKGLVEQNRGNHGGRRQSDEGPVSCGHLVQRDPEREHVGRRPRRRAANLLGRHVRHRAEDHAGSRFVGGVRDGASTLDLRHACETEIQHLRIAVRADHHVLGLDVAMHDTRGMRGLEGSCDLPPDIEERRHRHLRAHP